MRSTILILAMTLGLVATAGSALAQQQQTPSDAPVVSAPAVPATSIDYQIGPGDMLTVRVSGVKEFDRNMRVSNSGRVRVPYVGIIYAAGKTTPELEREIAEAIRDHELVNEPMVRVQVEQQRALPAFVVGEVATPGQFTVTGEMYLLDLLSRAGGLTPMADAKGFIYRRSPPRPRVEARISAGSVESVDQAAPPPPLPAAPPPSTPELPDETDGNGQVIPIDLDLLQEGTNPEINIPLLGGDVVYIPRRQARTFYIIGDVKTPGAYSMPRKGGVSAAQAIIYAGGPLMTAKAGSAFLMRHDPNGVRQALPVDFRAIIDGKKPDLPIQADDIIFIPNSAIKTIGTGLLGMIPQAIVQFIIF